MHGVNAHAAPAAASSSAISTMLMAMESSCMGSAFPPQRFKADGGECCYCGLTEADAAIVSWDCVVGPNFEECILQSALQIRKEQFILKDATGERDSFAAVRGAESADRVGYSAGQAKLKGARALDKHLACENYTRLRIRAGMALAVRHDSHTRRARKEAAMAKFQEL
jgi:hypothetical protein